MRFLFKMLLAVTISSCFSLEAAERSKEDQWQRVYLATYPRCGNHWMRSLLEEATHVVTSSVYLDREPIHLKKPFPWGGYAPKNGLEGDSRYPEAGEIVLVKTHYPAKPLKEFDLLASTKTIRIVRHPVDSFYSHYVHFDRFEMPSDGKIPSSFVRKSVKDWKKFEKYWNKKSNVHTVKYEDMLIDIDFHFRQILTTIGYQLKEEDIQRALQKFPARGGPEVKHLGDYHPEDLEYIQRKLCSLMQNYGYSI